MFKLLSKKKIRTRFAPSPTGFLHVGGLRTALYNYLYAKKYRGEFILRIEDTDQERIVPGASEHLEVVLKNFGLQWDNEEIIFQSKKLETYQQLSQQLIATGKAYYCFCTKERLDRLREEQQAAKKAPRYDRFCLNLSEQEISSKIESKTPHVIRLKMPQQGTTSFQDIVRGQIKFDNSLIDDQIIIKSDGYPTYHLASVVDDHQSEITHVIRGEEWLPSTPKHILLYQAFSWTPPQFAHLPLLLNADKSKLSKRQGDVNAEDYLQKGYLPEALLNFVLLLGWNPGTDREVFNLKEMIREFSLEKVNKSGAVFNVEKLNWLNSEYIKKLDGAELAEMAKPYFNRAGIQVNDVNLEKIVITEQERIKKMDEIVAATKFFFEDIDYDPQNLVWKKSDREKTVNYLKSVLALLKNHPEKKWTTKDLEKTIKNFITQNNLGMGDVLWPVRFALSGLDKSPGPFEIANALGQKKTLSRLEKAIVKLEK